MCCNGFRIILMFTLTLTAFTLNNFMPNISVILWYILSINLFTFFLFSIDKLHAIKDRKRVEEITLHFFSFAGGFIGAFLAMLITRHKIRKYMFLLIQVCIVIFWAAFLFFFESKIIW